MVMGRGKSSRRARQGLVGTTREQQNGYGSAIVGLLVV
jgi:hypothetical protein